MASNTEADTCRKYVLPKLSASGWSDDYINEQRTFTDGRIVVAGNRTIRRKQKRADYLLRYPSPSPDNATSATWSYQIGTYTIPSGTAYVKLYAEVYIPTGATVGRFDDGFVSAGTVYYHQDYLSNRLITNSLGADVAEQGHFPFGELWYPSTPVTKFVLTGKERDSESGLDNFGARYDSSQYGRFMSPDPGNAGANPTNPQSWNMYSYVWDNPVNLTDPSGMDVGEGMYAGDMDREDGVNYADKTSPSGHCGILCQLIPGWISSFLHGSGQGRMT